MAREGRLGVPSCGGGMEFRGPSVWRGAVRMYFSRRGERGSGRDLINKHLNVLLAPLQPLPLTVLQVQEAGNTKHGGGQRGSTFPNSAR